MWSCHVCKREIPRNEFAAQRAIMLLRRVHCRDCAEAIGEGRPPWRPAGPLRRLTRLVLGRDSQGTIRPS